MTLHLNFGPNLFAPLPFKCRMLQDAATVDIEIMAPPKTNPDGKCEVLFPVGLPDEGTFDWLDGFLKENPHYTELSSRMILDWGLKSGLWRRDSSHRGCNDRPIMDFGIREIDDDSIRKLIQTVAPILRRNYVFMEVRNNLLASERAKALELFDEPEFRKVALVVI